MRPSVSSHKLSPWLWTFFIVQQALLLTSWNIVQVSGSLALLFENPAEKSPNTLQPVHVAEVDQFDAVSNDLRLFNEAMKLSGDAKLDLAEDDKIDKNLIAKASPGLLERLIKAAKETIAPAKSYYDMILRYNGWRQKWNKLRDQLGTRPDDSGEYVLRSAMDVIRLEYAKVDNELMSRICYSDKMSSSGEKTAQKIESENENMDFIARVLGKLIQRLEGKLADYEGKSLEEVLAHQREEHESDQKAEKRSRELEQDVLVASSRAKRIAARSVANLVAQEVSALASLLAFDTLATYAVNSNAQVDGTNGIMSRIEPFVLLLGSANTPIIISYLRNIQFRATLNLVNYSVCKLMPTDRFKGTTTNEKELEVAAGA